MKCYSNKSFFICYLVFFPWSLWYSFFSMHNCFDYYLLSRIHFLVGSFWCLYCSCTLIGITFFRLTKFSSRFCWNYLLCIVFSLYLVFQIYSMFYDRISLNLTFYFIKVSIIISSEILFSTSCILLAKLESEVLVWVSGFFICFSLLILFSFQN